MSTGTLPTNRFPGQWFQSESGLHQNWMRDYDPTTGRYLQADPLGLVDGASVYGYVGHSPMRWVDPKGEFAGPLGAVLGAGGNFGLQFIKNLIIYGEVTKAFNCVDFKSVLVSGIFGAGGVSPITAWITGGNRSAIAVQGIISYAKLETGGEPWRFGDACECKLPDGYPAWIDSVFNTLQL